MSSCKEHLDLNSLDDEEDLTDDEVFTRSGKSLLLEENGVNKPLMAPRHRTKGDLLQTRVRRVPSMRVVWAPLMYGLVALGSIVGIIVLVVFVINTFIDQPPKYVQLNELHQFQKSSPCSNVSAEDVWTSTFPMLTTETAIRLVDLNGDSVDDIVLGFGTGADAFSYPVIVCEVYFNGANGCGGGLLALDGKSGKEIWRVYTQHEIFAVNCNVDIDRDGVMDCLGGGRMAGLIAVSGKRGQQLWVFNDKEAKIETSNIYTPHYIRDLDDDSVPDLLVMHGGDPLKEPGSTKKRLVGRIMLMSAKTGQVLSWMEVPDGAETYYSPQILTYPDGLEMVLFGTGGETHGGALWMISLNDLIQGQIQNAKAIYTDSQKGIMTPPVLVDLTNDGVYDIVMAMFNSTVIAFDGRTFEQIWNTRFPSSETYSTPGVGFFNNDSVPDFIVNYQTGPGFPVYYYTQTTILDGRNGKPLLQEPVRMVVGTQSSPLVVSVDGKGNDIFLYWVSDCHGVHDGNDLKFEFLEGTSVHEQSRSDFCRLRFKERLYTKMYAMTNNTGIPGVPIYNSDTRKSLEFGNQLNYTEIGLQFKRSNPQRVQKYYQRLQGIDDDSVPLGDNQYSSSVRKQRPKYASKNHHNIQGGMRRYPGSVGPIRYKSKERGPQNSGGGYGPAADYSYPDLGGSGGQYYGGEGDDGQNWQEWPATEDGSWPDDGDSPKMYSYNRGRHFSNPRLDIQRNRHENFPGAGRKWKRSVDNEEKNIFRRHVGPHDNGGIQRIISTGTLAPFVGHDSNQESIDVIFATFWFYPSKTRALLPEDRECIENRLANERERFTDSSEYRNMDHDRYEKTIITECLKKSKHYAEDETSRDYHEYNPFDRQMGQMTVYRRRITCQCTESKLQANTVCAKVSPFEYQGWSSYMGRGGDCAYIPRPINQ